MSSPARAPHKILIVEDDNDIRNTLSQILQLEGFEVACAVNGQDGLLVLESFKADIILLDLMMPVMSGYEFRKHQRQNQAISAIPVVVLSADVHAPQKSAESGFQAILKKPVELELLLSVLREQLTE